jgi:hypothetical protein
MFKRLLTAGAALLVMVVVGMILLVRGAFGSDSARTEISDQLSRALGQTVKAGSISASPIGPTITVRDIAVGDDAAVHIDALQIHPGISALITRRFDGAAVTVSGLHAVLPLKNPLAIGRGGGPLSVSQLASLAITDLEISTHGRRLRINADLHPHGGHALTIARLRVDGDDMHADLNGEITDLTAWRGELNARGDSLDGDVLRSLAWDLLDQPDVTRSPERATAASGYAPLAVNLDVARLTLGPVAASSVKGKAALGPGAVVLDPVSFSVFGGRYQGQVALRFEGGEPAVRWYGDLSNISLAGLTTAATGPPAIAGILSGDVDLAGTGVDFAHALTSVRGSARVTLADGRIGNLGLVRSIVAASAPNPQQAAQQSSGPGDTPFKTFATALSVSGGSASLLDLRIDSDELTLLGGGGIKLDGSAVTIFADVQMSEAVSRQVAAGRGRTLEPGARLTVPVTIRGGTSHYQISVELQEMTTAPLTTEGRR